MDRVDIIKICEKILQSAESERIECAEAEAKTGLSYEDEDHENP